MAIFSTFVTAFDNLCTKMETNFSWCKTKINSLTTDLGKKALTTDLTTHTGNTTVHITADERKTWNAKQNALTDAQIANINAVPNKADKTAIPTKVSQLTNDSKYVTQSEMNDKLNAKISREVVDTLPAVADAKENVIYMTPNEGKSGNVKNEYMLVDGAFELIGTTEADLSGYVKAADLDTELAEIFNNAQITELK